MSEWRVGQVSDFAKINPKDPPLAEDAPFITMADVNEWGVWAKPSGPRGRRGGARAQGGDVIMARITPCLENGKIAYIPDDLGPVGGSTEFIVLRPTEAILAGYLLLWAQSPPTHQRAVSLMAGSTGRQRVGAADVAAIPLHLPPLSEQRRIVHMMAALDEHASALSDEIDKLRAVFVRRKAELYRGFAENGTPFRLGDVLAEIKRPIVVDPAASYRQIGVRSHGRGIFTKEPVTGKELGSKKVFWVEPGDLVINIVFAWEGAVALMPDGLEGYCGSHRFPTYRRTDDGEIDFFRYYFTTADGVALLADCSPGGCWPEPHTQSQATDEYDRPSARYCGTTHGSR